MDDIAGLVAASLVILGGGAFGLALDPWDHPPAETPEPPPVPPPDDGAGLPVAPTDVDAPTPEPRSVNGSTSVPPG